MQTNAARGVALLRAYALALAVAGCAGDAGPPPCVVVKTDCQPLYDPPTYTAIFDKIFQPTCASGQGTCHTSDAKKGGLFFQDSAQAYQLLLGKTDGRARVIPDNPGCSLLAERLASSDRAFEMPPGMRLSDAELCTIMKWLAAGAPSGP